MTNAEALKFANELSMEYFAPEISLLIRHCKSGEDKPAPQDIVERLKSFKGLMNNISEQGRKASEYIDKIALEALSIEEL